MEQWMHQHEALSGFVSLALTIVIIAAMQLAEQRWKKKREECGQQKISRQD
jgi:hypothetical protein